MLRTRGSNLKLLGCRYTRAGLIRCRREASQLTFASPSGLINLVVSAAISAIPFPSPQLPDLIQEMLVPKLASRSNSCQASYLVTNHYSLPYRSRYWIGCGPSVTAKPEGTVNSDGSGSEREMLVN